MLARRNAGAPAGSGRLSLSVQAKIVIFKVLIHI
jgi:hypothetical protein